MPPSKTHIIAALKKEILPLQGFKSISRGMVPDMGLGPVSRAFPQNRFPLGAVHEFIANSAEDAAASCGFMAGLLSPLLRSNGCMAWISSSRSLFPPALKNFGIEPDRVLFINLQKEKELLWAMEEALKSGALAAVIAELPAISFTASRRLQLAVEQSQSTGLILRQGTGRLNSTACIARWKISSLKSSSIEALPGIGFPRWNVELLKIRNGQPGSWQLQWEAGKFVPVYATIEPIDELQTKTG